MKAIRVHQTGGPDVLRYEDSPTPEPAANQVRINVAAAGVNFIDTYQRKGQYPMPLPFIPGQEIGGTVDALGAGVTDLSIGDTVTIYQSGLSGYAEYVVANVDKVIPVPAGVSAQEAAAVLLQGMSAHYLSHDTFALQAGQTALIHAAAGGTGALLVQMAKARGATVIGTVSSEAKAQLAREAGADHVIVYTEQDFAAETKRITQDAGVHVVYDSVGIDTFDKSLAILRPLGMMVLYGQSSGPVPSFDPQILNAKGSLFLTRPSLGHYTATRAALLARANAVFSMIASQQLIVRIDQTFPLANATAAHEYLEARGTKGKLLLIP
jgi:NADPH:quinone reductase